VKSYQKPSRFFKPAMKSESGSGRFFKVDHHYVGGYYGAASEEEMKRELVGLGRRQRRMGRPLE
jgi:hypothetical protein